MEKGRGSRFLLAFVLFISFSCCAHAFGGVSKEEKREQELKELQKRFEWWPTDAKPAPVKDTERGGYWWWPEEPGSARPWGNRGNVYVYKIIFDYKEDELPPPKPKELRPSLLIKKIIKNVKVYFDFDKSDLREDVEKILTAAVGTLKRNPQASILITGNCDIRGSESYNEKLGRQRADAVKRFMLESGTPEEHIRIISKGKLNAIAPVTDLVGMQKDRSAQFMIAEVEEVMIPYPDVAKIEDAEKVGENKFLVEEEKTVESKVEVGTRVYVIQKDDTLSKIAKKELGSAHRWKYLYELNKEKIKNPDHLEAGQKIVIPVE